MNTIRIDGKETPFQFEDGSLEGVRNDRANGLHRIFIMGHAKDGRLCRVSSVALPLQMFTQGGKCTQNGKVSSHVRHSAELNRKIAP